MNEKAIADLQEIVRQWRDAWIEAIEQVDVSASEREGWDGSGSNRVGLNEVLDAFLALPPLRAREEIARIIVQKFLGVTEYPTPEWQKSCLDVADAILSRTAEQVCGACGHPWTGEKCGQAENDHPFPTCYPVSRPGQEWRDISSAPKDGSPILCVWWSNISVGEPLKSHVGICWWSGGWNPYARTLTHWMPLPAPPVAEPLLADNVSRETLASTPDAPVVSRS